MKYDTPRNTVISPEELAPKRLAGSSPLFRTNNNRVVPTRTAAEGSAGLAHEFFNQVFRKVPNRLP
jgi:hypothetical protein